MPFSSGYNMEAGKIFLLNYTNLRGKQPHGNSKRSGGHMNRLQRNMFFFNWDFTLCSLIEAKLRFRKSYYPSYE
jgi:hypothetical protein